jgi:hypothetical protein
MMIKRGVILLVLVLSVFLVSCSPGKTIAGQASMGVYVEEVCDDGIDNDEDGYYDCHDYTCGCYLGMLEGACCLDHNSKSATYTEYSSTGICNNQGQFPVVNSFVCQKMAEKLGYVFIS